MTSSSTEPYSLWGGIRIKVQALYYWGWLAGAGGGCCAARLCRLGLRLRAAAVRGA